MRSADFWHDKWKSGKIGFHQADYHPALVQHWPSLNVRSDASVFVPLCGKSKDMLYLREQNHDVVGIELSRIAIDDFGKDTGIALKITSQNSFECHNGSGFTLLIGDYFQLRPSDLKTVGAVYDRAALIALPSSMRQDYAAHLQTLLPSSTEILLITLTYDQSKMQGPPFSVSPAEVTKLYGSWCTITQLAKSAPEDFRGIQAHETIYRITVK